MMMIIIIIVFNKQELVKHESFRRLKFGKTVSLKIISCNVALAVVFAANLR